MSGVRGPVCANAFDNNLASVSVKFLYFIFFIEKFCNVCIFNAICKDNSAVKCITFWRKKGSFPSVLTATLR